MGWVLLLLHLKRFVFLGFVSVSVLLSTSGISRASSAQEQERKRLFEIIFTQPDNLDAALSYAALSVKLGDLEGAISTLERMLLFAPGLPALQVELGVLYYKLGNFDTAEGYFKEVLKHKGNISDELYANVEKYLEAIEKRLNRFRWSGKTFVGLRWQDNITLGPSSANVLLNGIAVTLPNSAIKKSGFSLVTSSRAHFEYDFLTQGDRLELDYVDFGSVQFGQSSLNTQISEVTFGPSFNLGRFGWDDTYSSIYAIANGALLGKSIYFGTLGVGTRLITRPSNDISLILKGEFRNRWYRQSNEHPTAKQRNGKEYRGVGLARYRFDPNFRISLGVQISRKDRNVAHLDYWEYGSFLTADWRFEGVKVHDDLPWRLTATAGYLRRDFDTSNAVQKRHDDEYWVRGVLEVPVTQAWAVVPKAEYRRVKSNYATSDYGSFSATIGVQYTD